ncbi:amino acid ABC transporter ATP-binding protein [Phyllobacterium sp. SB3]|uniref:amino acid ABC transporter ATP-binding protein n=1 Tax=Phyllobacterium sp. SB3 TaxID=3156073 RepID=UPI0032AEE8D8
MPVVQLNNIEKSYGTLKVLDGISLSVESRQVVAVIGRSGSGKSTMLRCINGLEPIQAGSIEVATHKLLPGKKDLRELRMEVGIVFQSYNLFPHLTVQENITLAPIIVKSIPKKEAEQIAESVLRQVGLIDKLHKYAHQLSGGQQQRVAIARSLAMQPKVMLFDEVTSALDPELTGEVLTVMKQLAEDGMTMILVTHEMAFAREVADITVFMHNGRIWEFGPSKELFENPKTDELKLFVAASR